MSTKYKLCISSDFLDNINIYFFMEIVHKLFVLTLLFSEICSIFNSKQKLREFKLFVTYK